MKKNYNKTNKKTNRKPYRKKSNNTTKRLMLPTAPPNYQLVKLKYCEEFVLSMNAVLTQDFKLVRINDLFDPNYSGSGHQPYFRDQLYNIYKKARVLSSKIIVQFAPDTNQPMEVILTPLPDATSETNFTLAKERKGTRHSLINLGKIKTLYAVSPTHTALGVSKPTVRIDDLFVQTTSSSLADAQSNYWQFGAKLMNPISSATCVCSVKIEMITLFSDPIQQTQS